jgi:hypothetical protein
LQESEKEGLHAVAASSSGVPLGRTLPGNPARPAAADADERGFGVQILRANSALGDFLARIAAPVLAAH